MALAPGSPAPSFQLESSDGGTVSSADLAGKIVVLYFYPRDNTPGCTIEAQEFRDHLAQFRDAGAVVFGISRDSIASHCKFRDKFGLTFPLLTDPDGAMMGRFQAWGDKVMYGKKVTGVIRSTVVIDQQGKVSRHWPKVVVKDHAAKVLEHVQSLAGGGAREGGGGGKPAKPAKSDSKDEGAPAKKPVKVPQALAKKPAPKAKKPAPMAKKPAPKAKKSAPKAKKPAPKAQKSTKPAPKAKKSTKPAPKAKKSTKPAPKAKKSAPKAKKPAPKAKKSAKRR